MRTLGVFLAAGASRRFGPDDKLLADWQGAPLVLAAARTLADAGCDGLLAVISSDAVGAVLPPEFRRCRIAPGLPMSQSLRAARDHMASVGAARALVVLADMPAIRVATLRGLLATDAGSHACCAAGVPMPPALLVARDLARLSEGDGDFGARQILRALPPDRLHRLSNEEASDIDLRSDLTPG